MKPIVLEEQQWENILENIKNRERPSVYLMRGKMKEVLGFTVREHQQEDGDSYWGRKIHLDFYDEQKRVITDSTAAANMPNIPGYVVFDAMAGYSLNKNASVNLNVYNLADKEYISTLNNGGGRVILGQPRSAALTFNYKF